MTRLTLVLLAFCVALVSVDADQFRIRVGRPPTPVGGDTTPPVVTITSPTSASTFNTSTTPLTTLAGTASDNVGVVSCSWSSSNGGSGSTTGTTSWSVPSIALVTDGNTIIEVVCVDAASNQGSDTLTVTHTTGGGGGGGDSVDSYFTGTTRTAASCSRADVGTTVAASSNGDIVTIPTGSCTWDSPLVLSIGIKLQGSGTKGTEITDGVPKTGGGQHLIHIQANEPQKVRITNLVINGGFAGTMDSSNVGAIAIAGTTKAFRIDNIRHYNNRSSFVRVYSHAYGVLDTNTFEFEGSSNQALSVTPGGWGGSSYGDGSFAEQLYLGTEKAIYFENNTCTLQNTGFFIPQMIDVVDGGRVVTRFNTINGCMTSSHGTESGGRRRGMRSFEHYHNTNNSSPSPQGDTQYYMRGGTGVIFNNAATGTWNSRTAFLNFRDSGSYNPWGQCNGSSVYDGNVVGGWPCVDQIGRGTSNHLNGAATPTAQWVGNILDPAYAWSNTGGSYVGDQYGSSANVSNNRDYYHDVGASCTAGGSCTTGVGIGTTLPTSCTAGVGFWKTNEGGNWNTTNGTADDGRLYKCTATNTWTAWYTPFVYPHPFRGGS
jgi:hypothetical protein